MRVALSELQRALAAQSRAEIVKFFLDGDVEWRLARIERQEPPNKRDDAPAPPDVTPFGSLYIPNGPGPHPAVVFLHGAGPEIR